MPSKRKIVAATEAAFCHWTDNVEKAIEGRLTREDVDEDECPLYDLFHYCAATCPLSYTVDPRIGHCGAGLSMNVWYALCEGTQPRLVRATIDMAMGLAVTVEYLKGEK